MIANCRSGQWYDYLFQSITDSSSTLSPVVFQAFWCRWAHQWLLIWPCSEYFFLIASYNFMFCFFLFFPPQPSNCLLHFRSLWTGSSSQTAFKCQLSTRRVKHKFYHNIILLNDNLCFSEINQFLFDLTQYIVINMRRYVLTGHNCFHSYGITICS